VISRGCRSERSLAAALAGSLMSLALGCQASLDLDSYSFDAAGASSVSSSPGGGGVSESGEGVRGAEGMPAAQPGSGGLEPPRPCTLDETTLDGCVLVEE
jgi:hypothetical protein